jgi:hypothetical protein
LKSLTYVSTALTGVFLAVLCAAAQNNPGNILAAELQMPKPGMTQHYEQGRKQKAEWHKQQNGPDSLYVSQIVSGQETGTYLVTPWGTAFGRHGSPADPRRGG